MAATTKPSYLGLLNGVSNAESDAHEYLEAWCAVTCHEGVRAVLQTVSAREGEHGLAFAKRINELGFTLQRKVDPDQARRMEVAASDRSDLQKMDLLGLGRGGEGRDVFDSFFEDHSIDVQTGALLGRYIAEERDSGRLLRACSEQLRTEGATAAPAAATPAADRLAALEDKVDAVCRAVEEVRQIVCAQSMPVTPA